MSCPSIFRIFQSVILCLASLSAGSAAEEPKFSEAEIRVFLQNAKVIDERKIGKGVTGTFRLTLTDGAITHYAHFQSADEYERLKQFGDGKIEMNFRDSYKYNIAAYELARLLGLGEMMPVTVERKYGGKTGAIDWWLDVKMDEESRQKEKIQPPDKEAWMAQVQKMRVFSQLVYDTDRNLGNLLYGNDWHVWMIDFTRAFRLSLDLQDPKALNKCSRQLLEKLRELDANELMKRVGHNLTKTELHGVMARRDKIVLHFEKLISEKGELEVLY